MSDDRHVVQCNCAEGTSIAQAGARAYVVTSNPGWGQERIEILVRSRGGRWVRKWERTDRLTNFRGKTLPPEHPLHGRWELLDGEPAARFLAVIAPVAPDIAKGDTIQISGTRHDGVFFVTSVKPSEDGYGTSMECRRVKTEGGT